MGEISAPSKDIDWNHLTLPGPEVNGHIESHYSVTTGKWSAPVLVKDPFLKVHGLSTGLNYGQQCYEGLKAFRTSSGAVSIFRPQKHSARMNTSGACVSIPPIPEDHFVACCTEAVLANSSYLPPHESQAMMYVRPVAFSGVEMIGLAAPPEFTFCVFVKPFTAYHGAQPLDALVIDGFDRAAPRGTGHAKVGGNYAPVLRWSDAARREGYGLTLHLDSATRTEIDEFSTSGFVGIKYDDQGNTVVVVPDSVSVIDSVTSDCCLTLARSFGWIVEKRSIPYEELPTFSEVMAVGTAACLVPVRSISRTSTGDKFCYSASENAAGPCCQILGSTLDSIMRGNEVDTHGWCHIVGGQNQDEIKLQAVARTEEVSTEKFSHSTPLATLLGFGSDYVRLSCQ